MSEALAKLCCSDKVFFGTGITALFKVCLPATEIGRSIIRINLYYASIVFDSFIKIIYPQDKP